MWGRRCASSTSNLIQAREGMSVSSESESVLVQAQWAFFFAFVRVFECSRGKSRSRKWPILSWRDATSQETVDQLRRFIVPLSPCALGWSLLPSEAPRRLCDRGTPLEEEFDNLGTPSHHHTITPSRSHTVTQSHTSVLFKCSVCPGAANNRRAGRKRNAQAARECGSP